MAGIIKNDREQGARVRRLLLNEIERLFSSDPLTLSETENGTKRELLLRMAANTLPRLHEVTGEDGGSIKIAFDPVFNAHITPKTEGDSPEPSKVQDSQSGA